MIFHDGQGEQGKLIFDEEYAGIQDQASSEALTLKKGRLKRLEVGIRKILFLAPMLDCSVVGRSENKLLVQSVQIKL